MKKLKTFESYFSNLFNKKSEKPEEVKIELDPVDKFIDFLEKDTIENLHDFGYSDANNKNIYTNDIYAFHFKNRLENKKAKYVGNITMANVAKVSIINDVLSKITANTKPGKTSPSRRPKI